MSTTTIHYFEYAHLPEALQQVAKPIAELAHLMEDTLPDGPEKSTGMRKLLEAKDCFVRTRVVTKIEFERREKLQSILDLCKSALLAAPEDKEAESDKARQAILALDDFYLSQHKGLFSRELGCSNLREFDAFTKGLIPFPRSL